MLLNHLKRSKTTPCFQVDFEHLVKGFFASLGLGCGCISAWLLQRALGDISERSIQPEMLEGSCSFFML